MVVNFLYLIYQICCLSDDADIETDEEADDEAPEPADDEFDDKEILIPRSTRAKSIRSYRSIKSIESSLGKSTRSRCTAYSYVSQTGEFFKSQTNDGIL